MAKLALEIPQKPYILTVGGVALIEFFSKIILRYICNKKVINEEEIELYKYGIEITLSSLLNIILILLISLITNTFYLGITFLTVFISVRKYTGGFHANTYLTCNFTFVCCYLTVVAFTKQELIKSGYLHILISLLCILVILLLCPIENKNKKISNKKKMKLIAIISYLFWSVFSLIFIFINPILSNGILFTLYLITGLVIIGFIKERLTIKSQV